MLASMASAKVHMCVCRASRGRIQGDIYIFRPSGVCTAGCSSPLTIWKGTSALIVRNSAPKLWFNFSFFITLYFLRCFFHFSFCHSFPGLHTPRITPAPLGLYVPQHSKQCITSFKVGILRNTFTESSG